MQVKIEDVSPVEKKLIVEVPWPTVQGRIGDAYKELAKSVQLKGFRKGKVPRSVLEQMFGKRVKAEVAGQLVRESFVTAVTEHNLQAVSEPVVEDSPAIERGKPFSFAAIVEVRGDIELSDWKGMQLTRRPVKVADEQVDEALEQLRRENTELHPIENRDKLADTDLIAVAIKGTVGEHAIDRPQLIVDLTDKEREPLPGLRDRLIGLALETSDLQLSWDVPTDSPETEIAGKKVEVTITVMDAREKEVPALDDEFAKDTGKADTLGELRAQLRSELEERAKSDIDEEVRKDALAELVKRNQVPVAASLVDRAVESKLQRLQMMFGMQAGDPNDLEPELKDKLRDGAADEVRGQLLLDAVATAENLEVAEEDVDKRVEEIARGQGQAPGRLRQEMDRDGRLDSIRFQLRQERTLDHIVSFAEVTEKEPEPAPAPEADSAVEASAEPASADAPGEASEPAAE